MDKERAYIARATKLARSLRDVMIKVIAVEKDIEGFERQEDEHEASGEHMQDIVRSFNEALNTDVPATELLAQIDQLIYSLLDMQPAGAGWHDEDEFKRREVLKLKEILRHDEASKLRSFIKV